MYSTLLIFLQYGTTALIWACRKGHFDVAKLLISKGANVNSVGTVCLNPLEQLIDNSFCNVSSTVVPSMDRK